MAEMGVGWGFGDGERGVFWKESGAEASAWRGKVYYVVKGRARRELKR
jgi:hypothetical protein